MLEDRLASILEAAVESFISTGEPISSGWLYKKYDFGIRPAMIRLELEELEKEGFLEQPHHSAGRVPTDEGYEFFAGRMMEIEGERPARINVRQRLTRQGLPNIAEELASELGLLSVAAEPARNSFYKEGLDALVEQMDSLEPADIKSVIHDFVEIENRLVHIAKTLTKGETTPEVFVGKKSPITKSDQLSVVMGRYELDGNRVFLFAIGPKRMDYRKTLRVFRNL